MMVHNQSPSWKQRFTGFWYSLPIQLLFLHLRKHQVLLLPWLILFATITGHFMQTFGAFSLFLTPEYFDKTDFFSTAIVGFATGVFIMSWNITTFILHGKLVRFLATTAQPFLKYCINNSLLPLIYLIVYLFQAAQYNSERELLQFTDIFLLASGFTIGLLVSISISFAYFFGADKTIYRFIGQQIDTANLHYALAQKEPLLPEEKKSFRCDWFLSAGLRLRKPRDVRHYSESFLSSVFNQHHAAAVIAIVLAFVFLTLIGFTHDNRLFQLPAAASITILFAILIALIGAISTFLRTWSIPVVLLVYLLLNWLYQKEILDPRNKAYGLIYTNKQDRPVYDRNSIIALAHPDSIAADKARMIRQLNNWKARQGKEKPVMYLINVSGGGTRSAAFTMQVLQHIDSLMGGTLMQQTALITGASGGMLGAAYYRELYHQKIQGVAVDPTNPIYTEAIAKDLLNPLFSSFVARELLAPAQGFTVNGQSYNKDRGYAFERKLNTNTEGILDKTLSSYAAPEYAGLLPAAFFNGVISRDGRKLIMAAQPVRFMMKATSDTSALMPQDPDAVDFQSFFAKQDAKALPLLSAMRINATFPYVLPNVWLPSTPIIDVMDAGLRDNYGQETALRFVEVFQDWLKENCSKVVLLQIRDRALGDWEKPLESKSLFSYFTKPFLILQTNWFKLQDYYQQDQLEYSFEKFGAGFHRVCFQYIPSRKDAPASLNFHLTAAEKKDIANAIDQPVNQEALNRLKKLMP
ncbi:MAG: hypothetical protein ACK4RX_00730 [Chitinophagaceae bacterium]